MNNEKTLEKYFEDQVLKTPHKKAIEHEQDSITYYELNLKANQLAKVLKENGVSENDIVAVVIERSINMIVAILAILKSGGAYLPINVDYPKERNELVISSSNAKLLIYSGANYCTNCDIKCLDMNKLSSNIDGSNLNLNLSIDNTACIIFTSGSTGLPKGAMLSHYSFINTISWAVEEYGISEQDNIFNKKEYEYARIMRKKAERRRYLTMRSIAGIVALSSVAIIGLLIQPTVAGDITIGMFTSLAVSIFALCDTLSWGIPSQISEFKIFFEYIKDINIFLSYEIDDELINLPAEAHPQLETVEFRDVSFKYPGTEAYILKNMNFILYSGKHYAIVGANGAGKTTVTKLITGLYDEYEGNIYINGRNLREYTPSEKMALTAVVYQDFARFPVDFHDNIALGNVLHMDDTPIIENAVAVLGLTDVVEKLPDGYKTPLTKIKGNGVDLSGGEWQRIALARLIVNTAPLKILDEPTAALDPVAESRVYEQFGNITNVKKQIGSIVIFISHRLGSTKLADEILVISNGIIAEQGTFRKLMSKDGIFAEMYNTQAEWYKEVI